MPAVAVKALQENRKLGVNPGRYRHCKCVGSVQGESRSLEDTLRRLHGLLMHKSGELLKWVHTEAASTASGILCCGKSAAASLMGAAVFCCDRCHGHIPLSVGTAAITTREN